MRGLSPLRRAATLLIALASSPWAHAQTCSVSASTLAFGTYNPQAVSHKDVTGVVTFSCQPHLVSLLLGYSIALSAGQSGVVTAREMRSGGNALSYQVYQDALRSTVWGEGANAHSGGLLLSILIPVSAQHTLYGRIPALQTTVRGGNYSDTLILTVTY